jgi:hypothetical protein
MIRRSIAKARRTSAFLFALLASALLATPAIAENFCDLLPAATVKSTLGLTDKLSAKPKSEGSAGCEYKSSGAGPFVVVADASDESGMRGTMFEQRIATPGPYAKLIPGLGDAAYYSETDSVQMAKFPGVTYTQQSIVFRAKGKIVSLLVTTPGTGIPKEALQSLATLAASKAIESLPDPSN